VHGYMHAENASHGEGHNGHIKVKGIPTRVATPGRRKVKFIVGTLFFLLFSSFFFRPPSRHK